MGRLESQTTDSFRAVQFRVRQEALTDFGIAPKADCHRFGFAAQKLPFARGKKSGQWSMDLQWEQTKCILK